MSEGYGEFYSLLRVRGDEDGTAGWLVISTKKNSHPSIVSSF